ncbi:hypothetical protein H8K32_06675 [Undibacterium jejuense]|uniref:Uncharacterized protein n=1 Tax=Undibacterium jejuense TaxID=1344949 RepID=A0A923KPJ5_9BURK|nr:hypothetical protein [Undibacterium jejuense]
MLIRRRANLGVFSETGKSGADRLTGKNRDTVELACEGVTANSLFGLMN